MAVVLVEMLLLRVCLCALLLGVSVVVRGCRRRMRCRVRRRVRLMVLAEVRVCPLVQGLFLARVVAVLGVAGSGEDGRGAGVFVGCSRGLGRNGGGRRVTVFGKLSVMVGRLGGEGVGRDDAGGFNAGIVSASGVGGDLKLISAGAVVRCNEVVSRSSGPVPLSRKWGFAST